MLHRFVPLLLVMIWAPLSAEVRDLKVFYLERCGVCHGPDGTARGPNGGKLGGSNLADPRLETRLRLEDLVAAIRDGKGAMPGYRRQLSEPEARKLVVNVLRPMGARKKP